MADQLPPCGIYRTLAEIAGVPAGRLVYFHNHGSPGPGVYLPETWEHNRARFATTGQTLPGPFDVAARQLARLPAEGFYRVVKAFYCCEKKCREFEADLLVQLGYNGSAEPILFVPELGASGVTIPTSGSLVAMQELRKLTPVKVAERHDHLPSQGPTTASGMLH